jgi:hypothetical protein
MSPLVARVARHRVISIPCAPIFLCFPLHCRAREVLHLDRIGRVPGAVGRALPFGDDAFEVHLAGVAENGLAVFVLPMLVEPDAVTGLG